MITENMTWDRGVDFEYMFRKIERHLKVAKKQQKCYDAVLLIQLRNGSRISEAARAFQHFIITGETKFEIKLSKARRERYRDIVIPQLLVDSNIRSLCIELADIDLEKLIERVKMYAYRTYKVNTHSLRYAFITFLLRNNVNVALISKIIGHSKLETLLSYVQTKAARELLDELI